MPTSTSQLTSPRVPLSAWTPEPFVPRGGLRGAHRQTLAGALLPRRFVLPPPEERLFQVERDVRVLCHCHWQPDRLAALTVVLIHGFEGSSRSRYVLGTASKAWAAGMNVVRMNIRNCGGTECLGPTLYHSGLSADVGAVAAELIERDCLPRLAIVGFSMGGNQVLKLAGELGSQAPAELLAVAAVSPGMDLIASSHALHQPRNRIYEWNFLWCLRRTMRRKSRAFPPVCAASARRWYGSVRQFDDCVTAPHFGFASADDYYTRASASPLLPRIAIPALVIHSTDDPFIIMTAETRARILANPNIKFLETSSGGHCGFVASASLVRSGVASDLAPYDGYWAERQVIEFLRRC